MPHILIVDDSATVRREVSSALSEFSIVEAEDGMQGAEILEQREDIALVICDVNMPRMTGLEMLERLKASLGDKIPKVLMLTTEGQPGMIRKARSLGAKGWVVKPFDPNQLLAAARKLTAA